MYQALVSHFELFDNYFCHKLSEFYYCKKNVWSYNIRINSLWLWAVGWGGGVATGGTLKGCLGRGVLPSCLNQKTFSLPPCLK